MSEPSEEVCRQFITYMLAVHGARLVNKNDSATMKAIATALQVIGVADRQDFLEHFATTIGRQIYVPFTPGVDSGAWTRWRQMVTVTHECMHVLQYRRLGAIRFGADYLRSSAKRAVLEAEAYRSNLELDWWRYQSMPDPHHLASLLSSYGCSAADVGVAEAYLRSSSIAVRHGAIINSPTKLAVTWLGNHAPELRA